MLSFDDYHKNNNNVGGKCMFVITIINFVVLLIRLVDNDTLVFNNARSETRSHIDRAVEALSRATAPLASDAALGSTSGPARNYHLF